MRPLPSFALPPVLATLLIAPRPHAATASAVQSPAPGVFVMGSADRYGSANISWVVGEDHVLLVGAPHPELVDQLQDDAHGEWLAAAGTQRVLRGEQQVGLRGHLLQRRGGRHDVLRRRPCRRMPR